MPCSPLTPPSPWQGSDLRAGNSGRSLPVRNSGDGPLALAADALAMTLPWLSSWLPGPRSGPTVGLRW